MLRFFTNLQTSFTQAIAVTASDPLLLVQIYFIIDLLIQVKPHRWFDLINESLKYKRKPMGFCLSH
jgi:hypothetical protein